MQRPRPYSGLRKESIINDFEDPVFGKYPLIGEIKRRFYKNGAVYSSMSGSGSTVYGIFMNKPELEESLKKQLIYLGEL